MKLKLLSMYFCLFVSNCFAQKQIDFSLITTELPIVVVVCSYNNAEWYEKNLNSIFSQEYRNYRVIYTNDCSTDKTSELVSSYIKKHSLEDKVTFVQNESRQYQLYNTWRAVHTCDDHEIIMIVDGDDFLAHDQVMQRINYEYQTADILMSYGQFRHYHSNKIGFCKNFAPKIIRHKLYRKVRWISSHLRTFYAGLFKQIKKEDLMYEGEFFKAGADLAAMFPMLEMANRRMKCIHDVLYVYTGDGFVSKTQHITQHVLKNRPIYKTMKEFL